MNVRSTKRVSQSAWHLFSRSLAALLFFWKLLSPVTTDTHTWGLFNAPISAEFLQVRPVPKFCHSGTSAGQTGRHSSHHPTNSEKASRLEPCTGRKYQAWPGPKKVRPGPLCCRKLQAQPAQWLKSPTRPNSISRPTADTNYNTILQSACWI